MVRGDRHVARCRRIAELEAIADRSADQVDELRRLYAVEDQFLRRLHDRVVRARRRCRAVETLARQAGVLR